MTSFTAVRAKIPLYLRNRPKRIQLKIFEVGNDLVWIQSGAKNFNDLELTNTDNGLLIEFGDVDIILENLDRNDISSSDFDFG